MRGWRIHWVVTFWICSASWLSVASAQRSHAGAELRYVPSREQVREIILENSSARYTLTLGNTVRLAGAFLKAAGADLFLGNPPLTLSSVRIDTRHDDVGFQLFTVTEATTENGVSVSVRQQSSYVGNSAIVLQTFTLAEGPELLWEAAVFNSATGGRSHRLPRTRTVNVTFPVMQQLKLGRADETRYLLPAQGQGSYYYIDQPDDFTLYFAGRRDPKMPIDIFNTDEDRGIYFHILKTAFEWNFADKDDFTSRVFPLTQEPGEESVILRCRIAPHEGDWHAAFLAFKRHVRSSFDFSQYERPVQERYRQQFVSHFTFLYGHDIYDPESNQFRIERFLDEGVSNFGGYDYLLLWHDYPRTGIDDRDQFALYEDLPGGLEGLRAMVEKAHARGVQVFIPYKPWDLLRGGEDHFMQEARISGAIGADGVFLDTMSASDPGLREALDLVNPDNVFVTEGRPGVVAAELVTGSWNQLDAANQMPNVDLLRFVLPEHNVHNSNRVARKRDGLVLNALFNGTGLIVWEDVFGEMNRHTWNERVLIRRYNRIIHENRDAFLTEDPVPLVADLREDLYVNAFPAPEKCVYPAYQRGREKVDRTLSNRLIGPFLEVDHPDDWHYVDVWNHQEIPAEKRQGKTRLFFPEEPADVMSCIVAMPKNLQVERLDQILRLRTVRPVEEAVIQINTVDNLTLIEEEVLQIPGNGGEVDLSQFDLEFPYLLLVKLMAGGVLKDQVVVDLGWKKWK